MRGIYVFPLHGGIDTEVSQASSMATWHHFLCTRFGRQTTKQTWTWPSWGQLWVCMLCVSGMTRWVTSFSDYSRPSGLSKGLDRWLLPPWKFASQTNWGPIFFGMFFCSPPARWGLLDFMSVDFRRLPSASSAAFGPQPRESTPSVPCRTPTARIHAKCSLPDLNRENPRQEFPAGPQPRESTPRVPCRTSTATIHAQCSLPDLNRDHPRPVFPAGPPFQIILLGGIRANTFSSHIGNQNWTSSHESWEKW